MYVFVVICIDVDSESSSQCLVLVYFFNLLVLTFNPLNCIFQYVDKDFGTGVLKISPGHDHNDYHIARKLGLPILNVMNKDGTLNEVAGLYRLGLFRN